MKLSFQKNEPPVNSTPRGPEKYSIHAKIRRNLCSHNAVRLSKVNLFLALRSRYGTIEVIQNPGTQFTVYEPSLRSRSRVTRSLLYTEPSYAEFTVYGAE